MDNHNNNNNNNLSNPPPPPPPQQQPPSNPTTTANATVNHHSNSSKENINSRDQFLRHLTHLNKLSHKISKPTTTTAFTRPSPSEPPLHPPPQQQQPPVYNISKSDFRDVVQRLTGSPAHPPPSSAAAPPPIHAPKPNSSRLQRIRPPPLAQLTTPLLRPAGSGFGPGMAPLSPLPPLPSCHGAAESPISAYMRFLNSAANQNMMFPPPDNLENVPPPQTHMSSIGEASSFMPPPPSSPLPFGCLPSPKSPCQLLSPNLHLPMSPTVSGAPSPK